MASAAFLTQTGCDSLCRVMCLDNNNLSGPIPESIGNLVNLRYECVNHFWY